MKLQFLEFHALLGSKCNPVSADCSSPENAVLMLLNLAFKPVLMLQTLCSDGSVSPCSALTPTVDILKKKYGLIPESS